MKTNYYWGPALCCALDWAELTQVSVLLYFALLCLWEKARQEFRWGQITQDSQSRDPSSTWLREPGTIL